MPALALSPVVDHSKREKSYFPLVDQQDEASSPRSPPSYAAQPRKLSSRTRVLLALGFIGSLVLLQHRRRALPDPSPYLPLPLNSHILPDQLDATTTAARPSWDDVFSRPQPILEGVKRAVRGLSREDAQLYDALVQHLPKGENRSEVCGTLYEEAEANQRRRQGPALRSVQSC